MNNFKTIDGNTAVSSVAYKFSEICGIYPITPASPMAENVDILFTDVDAIAGNGVVRSEENMEVKGPLYHYIVNQQFKTVNGIEGEYFSFNATGFDPSTNIPGGYEDEK